MVVTDKRNRRDGRFIEKVGFFNPIAKGKEMRLTLELDKINAWIAKGAQLSDRLNSLLAEWSKKQAA